MITSVVSVTLIEFLSKIFEIRGSKKRLADPISSWSWSNQILNLFPISHRDAVCFAFVFRSIGWSKMILVRVTPSFSILATDEESENMLFFSSTTWIDNRYWSAGFDVCRTRLFAWTWTSKLYQVGSYLYYFRRASGVLRTSSVRLTSHGARALASRRL